MARAKSKATNPSTFTIRPYQRSFISDDSQYRAVFAPRKSGKDLTVAFDITANNINSLIIIPFWNRSLADYYKSRFKLLGSKAEIIAPGPLIHQPSLILEFGSIYYTEPSLTDIQLHNTLSPLWVGKRVTYIGTPRKHRNTAIFEFIIKYKPTIHHWSAEQVYSPESIQYLLDTLAPDTFRSEIQALP